MDKGIIENEDVIYDVCSGKKIKKSEEVEKGMIEKRNGKVKEKKNGISVNVKEDEKIGMLEVVGDKVIDGMEVVNDVKGMRNKNDKK